MAVVFSILNVYSLITQLNEVKVKHKEGGTVNPMNDRWLFPRKVVVVHACLERVQTIWFDELNKNG